MHIEVLSFSATAPGSSGAAAAALSGDSLTIKNGKDGSRISLLGLWSKNQTAGFVQVASPLMHDSTRGIRVRANAAIVRNVLTTKFPQQMYAQDSLSAQIAGSAVAGDVELASMLLYYEDLPGVNARLIGADELATRLKSITTVDASITTTAGPGYSGSEALNAESDLLHANQDYAILGAVVGVRCLAVTLKGPDTSNLRIAVPGEPNNPNRTGSFFVNLAERYNMPLIPVINSANRASTFLEAAQDENAAAVTVSWILAELATAA